MINKRTFSTIVVVCIYFSLFGCDPTASKRVYLDIDLEYSSRDKIHLNISDNENIQTALRICDELFSKYGFVIQKESFSSDPLDCLRWYKNPKYKSNPSTIIISMNEDGNTLEVNIIDAFRVHSTPLSNELSEKVFLLFGEKFGNERVSKE